MVRALGRLTTKLQTELDENELIGTTERGLFRINRTDLRSIATKMELPDSRIDEVLKRAEKDGFIRGDGSAASALRTSLQVLVSRPLCAGPLWHLKVSSHLNSRCIKSQYNI